MHEQNVELVHTSLTSFDQRVKLHGAWFLILVGLTDFCYTLPLYTFGCSRVALFCGSHSQLSSLAVSQAFNSPDCTIMHFLLRIIYCTFMMKAGEMRVWELQVTKAGEVTVWELQVMKAHAISLCGLTIRKHILVV